MLLSSGGCAPQDNTALPGDGAVLARVNGSPITEYDLEEAIRSTLGDEGAALLDDADRKKVLESLVISRAIAQAQEASLTEEEKEVLERKVLAFREQLLVKNYIVDHGLAEPVTQEMVREYYDTHPEDFGAKRVKRYEMVQSTRSLKGKERKEVLSALKDASQVKDWQRWVGTLKREGLPLVFRSGEASGKLLHPTLSQVMASTKVGETSGVCFVQGVCYIVRIVNEREMPPQPLAEVRAQIRKMLVPVQLKKAVKRASEQVLTKAEVVYE